MEATTAQTQTSLRLKRFIPAAPQAVYDAWTDAEALTRWFAPTEEYLVHVAELDVQVGGAYRIEMRHQLGNTHTARGTFETLEPGRRLVMTFAWAHQEGPPTTRLTVELEEVAGGTELVLLHEGLPDRESVDQHREGWEGCLFRLQDVYGRTAVHHLSTTLALHRRLIVNALTGVAPHHLTRRLNDHTNHMLWVAGHVVYTRTMIAGILGAEVESPLAPFGDAISEEAAYPDAETILKTLGDVSQQIMKGLRSASPEMLAAPSPRPLPINDQTIGGFLDFLVSHEAYHIGQLGFLRKALGYPATSYAPVSNAPSRVPEGFNTVTSHLIVEDAANAIAFYEAAFGADELGRMHMPDGETVMHAMVRIGDSVVMIGKAFPEMGAVGPETLGGSPVTIHLYVPDADILFNQAVDAGAEPVMPLEDTFWGDRYGKVKDPFGHVWSIAHRIAVVPEEEMDERAAQAMAEQPS